MTVSSALWSKPAKGLVGSWPSPTFLPLVRGRVGHEECDRPARVGWVLPGRWGGGGGRRPSSLRAVRQNLGQPGNRGPALLPPGPPGLLSTLPVMLPALGLCPCSLLCLECSFLSFSDPRLHTDDTSAERPSLITLTGAALPFPSFSHPFCPHCVYFLPMVSIGG